MTDSVHVSDEIVVDDVRYELVDCRLRAFSNDELVAELATGLRNTCHFVREREGRPQLHVTESGTAALVITSMPHQDDKFCDTTIRAVRLDPADLRVSDDEQNIQSCSRGPYDDKLLVILSESVLKNP